MSDSEEKKKRFGLFRRKSSTVGDKEAQAQPKEEKYGYKPGKENDEDGVPASTHSPPKEEEKKGVLGGLFRRKSSNLGEVEKDAGGAEKKGLFRRKSSAASVGSQENLVTVKTGLFRKKSISLDDVGSLHVQVVEGRDLEGGSRFKPYVQVRLNGDKKNQLNTTHPKGVNEPLWYDRTVYPITEGIDTATISFVVKDHRTMIGKDKVQGGFLVMGSSLKHNDFVDMWYPLQKENVVVQGTPEPGTDSKPQIRVQLQYLLPGQTIGDFSEYKPSFDEEVPPAYNLEESANLEAASPPEPIEPVTPVSPEAKRTLDDLEAHYESQGMQMSDALKEIRGISGGNAYDEPRPDPNIPPYATDLPPKPAEMVAAEGAMSSPIRGYMTPTDGNSIEEAKLAEEMEKLRMEKQRLEEEKLQNTQKMEGALNENRLLKLETYAARPNVAPLASQLGITAPEMTDREQEQLKFLRLQAQKLKMENERLEEENARSSKKLLILLNENMSLAAGKVASIQSSPVTAPRPSPANMSFSEGAGDRSELSQLQQETEHLSSVNAGLRQERLQNEQRVLDIVKRSADEVSRPGFGGDVTMKSNTDDTNTVEYWKNSIQYHDNNMRSNLLNDGTQSYIPPRATTPSGQDVPSTFEKLLAENVAVPGHVGSTAAPLSRAELGSPVAPTPAAPMTVQPKASDVSYGGISFATSASAYGPAERTDIVGMSPGRTLANAPVSPMNIMSPSRPGSHAPAVAHTSTLSGGWGSPASIQPQTESLNQSKNLLPPLPSKEAPANPGEKRAFEHLLNRWGYRIVPPYLHQWSRVLSFLETQERAWRGKYSYKNTFVVSKQPSRGEFATLREAVAACGEYGDCIMVQPGHYMEGLVEVKGKNIQVYGNGRLDSDETAAVIYANFNIQVDEGGLSNLKIVGSICVQTTQAVEYRVKEQTALMYLIENCDLSAPPTDPTKVFADMPAVWAPQSSYGLMIRWCVIHNAECGVYMNERASVANIAECEFYDCKTAVGIGDGGQGNLVRRCTFRMCTYGVKVGKAGHCGVEENTFVGVDHSVLVEGGTGDVRWNRIEGGQVGIGGSAGNVENNDIFGTSDCGMVVQDSLGSKTVRKNKVHGGSGLGLLVGSSAGESTYIVENHIVDQDRAEIAMRLDHAVRDVVVHRNVIQSGYAARGIEMLCSGDGGLRINGAARVLPTSESRTGVVIEDNTIIERSQSFISHLTN